MVHHGCYNINDDCCGDVTGQCCRQQNLSVLTYLSKDRRFTKLVKLIASLHQSEIDELEHLLNYKNVTVFAPDNKAWNCVPIDYLLEENEVSKQKNTESLLFNVIKSHIVCSAVTSCDITACKCNKEVDCIKACKPSDDSNEKCSGETYTSEGIIIDTNGETITVRKLCCCSPNKGYNGNTQLWANRAFVTQADICLCSSSGKSVVHVVDKLVVEELPIDDPCYITNYSYLFGKHN
jgi:uncharacterized surface protein with fasciclin (FAS1) repeats